MHEPLHDVWSCADEAGHEEAGHVGRVHVVVKKMSYKVFLG
jgi:hypothetical protein